MAAVAFLSCADCRAEVPPCHHSIRTENPRSGAGAGGNKFAGYIDTETGVLHIDCVNEPSFWLDIRLNECAFWKHAPDGDAAAESKASFEARAAPQDAAASSSC